MSAVTLLAVDPDPRVQDRIRAVAVRSRYRCWCCASGSEALRRAREARPDAIVARLGAPDMSGRELVARLREEEGTASPAPILLLAERGQEGEVAEALERGAVNVLFFPFSEAELGARLGGLLRWARRPADEGVLTVGPVSVDLERGELLRPQAQPLTESELVILRQLLTPPGRALTRRQITVGTERAVDVHVAALRSKLGGAGRCIETIRGVGYRFVL